MVATTPLDYELLLRLTPAQPRARRAVEPARTDRPDRVGRPADQSPTDATVGHTLDAPPATLGEEPVARLEALVRRLSRQHTSFGRDDWLDDGAHELEQARELAQQLAAREVQLLIGLERLAGACANDPGGREARGARAAEAAARLPEHTARIEQALDGFHRLDAGRIRDHMRARRAECELQARRFRELRDLAEALRARLSRGRFLDRLFGCRLSPERRRAMAERLRDLTRRSRSRHLFIEKDELIAWLDGIVDAGLHLAEAVWLEQLQEARLLLFQLLNVHCRQDRVPAAELAAEVLLRADAHERFEYCPECEDFLARYLDRRRRELFGGGGALAVDRVARFQRTREHLIEEYLSRACGA